MKRSDKAQGFEFKIKIEGGTNGVVLDLLELQNPFGVETYVYQKVLALSKDEALALISKQLNDFYDD